MLDFLFGSIYFFKNCAVNVEHIGFILKVCIPPKKEVVLPPLNLKTGIIFFITGDCQHG